uniref:Chaoptin n=1 Tax=Macrostomum lignano TaxID=282301 RepID=A0A1I8GIH9_9PLAT
LFCRNRHSLPGDPATTSAGHVGGRPVAKDFLCSHGRLFVRSAGVTAIEGELARSLEVAPRLQWLDLSDNQLGALQQPHFASMPNLRRLELQNNAIASVGFQARVEPNSFECLEALEELRLERNLIAVLPNFAFKWLNSLNSLKLHGNRLESVEEFAFGHCCGRLTQLSLVDNQLGYLPDHLLIGMPNLTGLYLDRNQFDRVPSVRGPARLIDFHLQRNHIVRIRRRHFLAWSAAAESLNMFDNSLRWIEDGAFGGLPPGTVSLVLQKNELSSLGQRTLDGLTHLRYLVLADNRIDSIEDGAFGHLVRLETLSLAGNRLTSLRPNMFAGLNRTFALSLGSNEISSLPTKAFSRLPSLKYLYLEKNSLDSVPAGMLSGLNRLKKLDLSDNRISRLHPQALASQTDLAFLDLSGNRLSRLCSAQLLGPANRLSFLSLAKNRLTRLDPDLLSGLNRLQQSVDSIRRRPIRPRLTGGPARLRSLDLAGNPRLQLTGCSLCGLETLRYVRLPGVVNGSGIGDLLQDPSS